MQTSARALSVQGGVMALLMAWVDPYTIHLVGRWRSDMMLRYLHTTAKSFTEGLFSKMFQNGTYVLILPAHSSN